jgi:hypothetical protein
MNTTRAIMFEEIHGNQKSQTLILTNPSQAEKSRDNNFFALITKNEQ